MTVVEARGAVRRGRQAAVGLLRAARQPRHRRARAGGRATAGPPARWSLLDVKRGDIGSTAQAYADAYLDPSSPLAVDAITASPFLGFGSLDADDRHRTQARRRRVRAGADLQQGGREVQGATTDGGRPSGGRMIEHLRELNAGAVPLGSFGAVVGATIGRTPISTSTSTARSWRPAYGAQGGTAGRHHAGSSGRLTRNVLPSSSREVLRLGPDRGAMRDAVRAGQRRAAGPDRGEADRRATGGARGRLDAGWSAAATTTTRSRRYCEEVKAAARSALRGPGGRHGPPH